MIDSRKIAEAFRQVFNFNHCFWHKSKLGSGRTVDRLVPKPMARACTNAFGTTRSTIPISFSILHFTFGK